jgi:hypothetical protein
MKNTHPAFFVRFPQETSTESNALLASIEPFKGLVTKNALLVAKLSLSGNPDVAMTTRRPYTSS